LIYHQNNTYLTMNTNHISLRNVLQPFVTTSLFGPYILLSTLFSNTLSPSSFHCVRHQF
jgi:hypothetical protein